MEEEAGLAAAIEARIRQEFEARAEQKAEARFAEKLKQAEAAAQPKGKADGVPDELCCPISFELMVDPVMLVASGQTYERANIKEWLETNDTDPLTGDKLGDKTLRDNFFARSMCRAYADATA